MYQGGQKGTQNSTCDFSRAEQKGKVHLSGPADSTPPHAAQDSAGHLCHKVEIENPVHERGLT